MTDPHRSERSASAADSQERDRDARVEDLLLAGLDHYFAGQYELAISVWTRVLFLNHGHARARAYIDRARSAISERQRESDELVHDGEVALTRGDLDASRKLLTSALERGASSEEAFTLLDRLNRLQVAVAPARAATVQIAPALATDPDAGAAVSEQRPSRLRWIAAGGAAGIVVAAAAAWLWFRGADAWLVQATAPAPAAVGQDAEPLPVPAASEASLSRARTLQAKGRLHEALASLDAIRHGDASWSEAQQLRAAIQQQLLVGEGEPLTRAGDATGSQVPRP
jgi:tetratricopeptide (TPR) repeat protein